MEGQGRPHHGGMEAQNGAVEAQNGAVEAQNGALEGRGRPHTMEAQRLHVSMAPVTGLTYL